MRGVMRLAGTALAVLAVTLAVEGAAAQVSSSRFAAPADAAGLRRLAQDEAGNLARARAAVADMVRLARTPEERALAAADSRIVEQISRLVTERARLRQVLSSTPSPRSSLVPGRGGSSVTRGGSVGEAAGGGGQDILLAATRSMQDTQMSFNLQYLQLQSQMQHENRSYTAVSNIMKTKHDTVKNSISNIR